MIRTLVRHLPKWRGALQTRGRYIASADTKRYYWSRRNDPFTQMEDFMRNIEKRFWREFDSTFPTENRRRWPSPFSSFLNRFNYNTVGGPLDESTGDKFKLSFNFPNAKPENVKVTLKERQLTVEAKIEEQSDNSKMYQSLNFEYSIPEGVQVESLESILSNEGILTIEAPKIETEAPRSIPINREK